MPASVRHTQQQRAACAHLHKPPAMLSHAVCCKKTVQRYTHPCVCSKASTQPANCLTRKTLASLGGSWSGLICCRNSTFLAKQRKCDLQSTKERRSLKMWRSNMNAVRESEHVHISTPPMLNAYATSYSSCRSRRCSRRQTSQSHPPKTSLTLGTEEHPGQYPHTKRQYDQ